MAKGGWIGNADKARKLKKGWIGVDNKARKIKKGWLGVAGIARLIFAGGELEYYSTVTPYLTYYYGGNAAATPSYILFRGRVTVSSSSRGFDVYNTSLVHSNLASAAFDYFNSAKSNSYAWFSDYYAGHTARRYADDLSYVEVSYAYNNADVRDVAFVTTNGVNMVASLAFNASGDGSNLDVCYGYNSSLTRSSLTKRDFKESAVAASNGVHAILASSYNSMSTTAMSAYNASMVKVSCPASSVHFNYGIAARCGNYALFIRQYRVSSTTTIPAANVTAEAFNQSLVKVSAPVPSPTRVLSSISDFNDTAVLLGGRTDYKNATLSNVINVYDSLLVLTSPAVLPAASDATHAAASNNNFLLFNNYNAKALYAYTM